MLTQFKGLKCENKVRQMWISLKQSKNRVEKKENTHWFYTYILTELI